MCIERVRGRKKCAYSIFVVLVAIHSFEQSSKSAYISFFLYGGKQERIETTRHPKTNKQTSEKVK